MHRNDLERWLARQGYTWIRCAGSHNTYRNRAGYTVTVNMHGRRTFSAREMTQIHRDVQRNREAAARRAA